MQHVRKDGGAQTCHWHCDTVLLKELARIIAAPKALPCEVDGTLKGQSEALRLRMHHVLDSGLLLRGCAGCGRGCGCLLSRGRRARSQQCALCAQQLPIARAAADRLAWQQPRLGSPRGCVAAVHCGSGGWLRRRRHNVLHSAATCCTMS